MIKEFLSQWGNFCQAPKKIRVFAPSDPPDGGELKWLRGLEEIRTYLGAKLKPSNGIIKFMKLPNCKKVTIPREKLTDYLLSVTHPVGKLKAKLFREWGFDETNIEKLEEALRKIARTRKAIETKNSIFGTTYVVDGKIMIPRGGSRSIRTIWVTEVSQRNPRFITAYPL